MESSTSVEDLNSTVTAPSNEVQGLSVALFTMGLIYIVGMIGNILVLCIFVASKKLRTPQNLFIMTLAVADILALCQLPLVMKTMWYGYQFFDDRLCLFSACLTTFSYTASIASIMMVALGRYVSIVKLGLKDRIFTWHRCAVIVFFMFLLCMLAVSPAWTRWITKAKFNTKVYICGINGGVSLVYDLLMAFFVLGIPCNIILYSYLQIYRTFKKSKNSIKNHDAAAGGTTHGSKKQRQEIRLAVQLFLIFAIFCGSWTPFTLMVLFDQDGALPQSLYQLAQQLVIVNSAVNPPIYFYFNMVYRAEFIRLLKLDKTKQYFLGESSASS